MTLSRRLAAGCAALTLGAGCGVPTGPESFEAIDDSDVPNRLNEPSTTSTTTTVPPETSTIVTTVPDQQDSTTTTSEPPVPTEIVDIFFVSRGQLAPKSTPARAPVSANELIDLLEAGSGSDLLDTEILLNLIETTSEDDGILTIELDDLVFRRIPVRDQREAIAQIVLTFLRNLRGVGQAVFTIDDERLTVPLGNGQFTDEPVSRDDYENMLVDADPDDATPITSTTAPTTTTTSVPTTEP